MARRSEASKKYDKSDRGKIMAKRRAKKNRKQHTEYSRNRRSKYRKKAEQFFGSNCVICGRKLTWGVPGINLHHIDGGKHKWHVVEHPRMWKKCILLCSMCHGFIHRLKRRYTEEQFDNLLYYVEMLREGEDNNISKQE